jgi:hypothetical protein
VTRPMPLETVPIDLRDRPGWLRGIVLARPGLVFLNEETGEQLRVGPRGELEAVLPGGRPGGTSAHSTATRRAT